MTYRVLPIQTDTYPLGRYGRGDAKRTEPLRPMWWKAYFWAKRRGHLTTNLLKNLTGVRQIHVLSTKARGWPFGQARDNAALRLPRV